ncbi:unnamed protein product [Cunninghamella blakesleeana]
MIELQYGGATISDLDDLYELEKESYHPDEAASKDQLKARIGYSQDMNEPPLLFLVARNGTDNDIVGYLCSTLSTSPLVTDKSLSINEPQGRTVCLHSVCVSPKYRRQGIATKMLDYWIDLHKQRKQFDRIAIMSRPSLLPLYTSVGFVDLGISAVVHGPEKWNDCVIDL